MGLCKCPKRDVTNQFCYEHRVNVCEHCMVKSHPKCIIQSYIQWLKDSDYNSSCPLCGDMLENDECVRLVCYHVFHWKCLNSRQAQLPLHTAPGGHTCPTCSQNIFPASNLVSPVADFLRNKLAQVNWGRNELSLPLFAEEKNDVSSSNAMKQSSGGGGGIGSTTTHNMPDVSFNRGTSGNASGSIDNSSSQHQIIKIDSQNNFQASSRRPLLARESPIGSSDRDDNKYKRKTPLELLSRWSRRFYSPSSRPPWRRTWFLVVTGILMFLLLIYIMAKLGRGDGSGDDDDFGNDFRHDR